MDARTGRAVAGGALRSAPSVSFMEADRNGDARITPGELDGWLAVKTGEHHAFAAADTNGDGVLTLDEWQAMLARPSAAAGESARGMRIAP